MTAGTLESNLSVRILKILFFPVRDIHPDSVCQQFLIWNTLGLIIVWFRMNGTNDFFVVVFFCENRSMLSVGTHSMTHKATFPPKKLHAWFHSNPFHSTPSHPILCHAMPSRIPERRQNKILRSVTPRRQQPQSHHLVRGENGTPTPAPTPDNTCTTARAHSPTRDNAGAFAEK